MHLAFPIMIGSIVETFYNLTDAFFLGKLGSAQVGAPSISFNIVFFLTVFGVGLSNAGMTLVSQSKGRGNDNKADHFMNQTVSLLTFVSVFLAILGTLLSSGLLKLLATPQEVYVFALPYMRIVFLGLPFSFVYFSFQASFTAIGDAAGPIKVHLLAVILNVILDPLLIYGFGSWPGWGVSGAAIATVLSQFVGALLSVIVMMRGRSGLKLALRKMRPDMDSWKLLGKIGMPASLGQGLSAFGFTVLQGVVNFFGTSAIAAFGVGNRIMHLFDIPTQGLSGATASLVGRFLGAKDQKSSMTVVNAALILVLILEIPLLTLAYFYGGGLVKLFVNDPEAIRLGTIMFQVVSPSLLAFGLFFALSGAFQGAGDTKIILALAVLRLWFIRVPLAYYLAFRTGFGVLSIWIAMFASNFITAIIGFLYYKQGKWRHALSKHEF
ncbi:MATE family efflux transporter [Spirochaetota bacterium]